MNSYCITDFGARVSDQLQTEAIQKALDTCFLNGGGRVVIPAGIFRTGGLRLRSNTELYLQSGAVLEGSRDPEDYNTFRLDSIEPITEPPESPEGVTRSAYPYSYWNNAIIRSLYAKNIAITGEPGSFIDGKNIYDPNGEEHYRGPHPINMWYCENISFNGYTVKDSGNWAHAIFCSRNITARNLTVYGGHDGFDVRTCDNILIEDCAFYTGDDCVAGFDNHEMIVRNCIFDCACSAMRLGGNNILIENCHSYAPSRFGFRKQLTDEQKIAGDPTDENCRHTMHAVFMYYCDFRANIRRAPGDILVRNCTFENPNSLLKLHFDGNHIWCCNRSLTSITFENCKITGMALPIQAHGDEKEPLTLTIRNSSIRAREGYEKMPLVDATYFDQIRLEHVTLEGYEEPTAILRTDGLLEMSDSTPVTVVQESGTTQPYPF